MPGDDRISEGLCLSGGEHHGQGIIGDFATDTESDWQGSSGAVEQGGADGHGKALG